MDTTKNNDKLQKLQMLKQEKQALEKKLNKVDIWVFPITIIVIGLGLLVNVFDIMSVDIATWIIGVLLIISLPYMGYSIVKMFKLRWAIDDIEREIKRIEKQFNLH